MDKSSFIKLEEIVKIFPPSNVALDRVTVDIQQGDIHSIIGENGAGKSTLMKVLFAVERPNSGTIYLNGQKVNFASPKDAVEHGIGMVHQEFMLIPKYSVLENIILGYEDTLRFGALDMARAREKFLKVAQEINFNVNPDALIEDLSVAIQQKVEIIKQLYRDVHILILDEPTAVLAPQEVQEFFKMIANLKSKGETIIFISHKLDEILDISDSITVMRQGKHIWTRPNDGLTKKDLAEAMVGRSVVFSAVKENVEPGAPVLSIQNVSLTSKVHAHKKLLDQISLDVREREIVGVAGVEGNGQYELVQVIIGLMEADEGQILVKNEPLNKKPIRERRRHIGYISQDRKGSGSSQKSSLVDNSLMTHHYLNRDLTGRWGLLSKAKTSKFAQKIIDHFNVITANNRVEISSLSGGNQQKMIVGREFELNSPLLVLDQPVRGLDVGSIEYIQKRIVQQRDMGTAVLLVSADLDELFSLSDRIIVMHKGKIVADKRPEETSRTEIGAYMLGSLGDAN